jgi:glycerol uptake facilitator-like aquaporin
MAYFNSAMNDIVYFLQSYGITDVVLPFLLIFTILFAVLQRIKLFGDNQKSVHTIVALIMSLLAVIPHVTRRYPANYDPIVIINTLIPSAAVLSIAIILILFLFGIFGSKFMEQGAPGWVIILILGVLFYIFGTTVGWFDDPSRSFGTWWNSELTALIVIILVFGIVIAFITSEEETSVLERLGNFLGKRYQ